MGPRGRPSRLTAQAAGLTLVTADRRAADTYALVDVDHRMLV